MCLKKFGQPINSVVVIKWCETSATVTNANQTVDGRPLLQEIVDHKFLRATGEGQNIASHSTTPRAPHIQC